MTVGDPSVASDVGEADFQDVVRLKSKCSMGKVEVLFPWELLALPEGILHRKDLDYV